MEIKISNEESHNIKIPDVVTLDEFKGVMIRLKELEKFIDKFFSYDESDFKESPQTHKNYKKRISSEMRPWTTDRDKFMEILKLHYFGNKEEKGDYVERYGRGRKEWSNITKAFHSLKKKFNVTPEEMKMIRFPAKHEKMEDYNYLKVNDGTKNGTKKEEG